MSRLGATSPGPSAAGRISLERAALGFGASIEPGNFLVGLLDPQLGFATSRVRFGDSAVHLGNFSAHFQRCQLLGEFSELWGLLVGCLGHRCSLFKLRAEDAR